VFVPIFVHTAKDAKSNSSTDVAGGEGAHRADAAARFEKEPFDRLRRLLRCCSKFWREA
jgi:hypothetical protein